jgi:hypothetical protein
MSDDYPPPSVPTVLTEAELAWRWQYSRRALQRLRAEGLGPAWIYVGGSVRYLLSDVLAREAVPQKGGQR